MKPSPTRDKSYSFALKVVKLCREIRDPNIRPLLMQLLRSATSIGANVEEASAAQSRKDFSCKMAIASKEAREAKYWLRLLRDSEVLTDAIAADLLSDAEELVRLLTSIILTVHQKDAAISNSKLKTQNSKLATSSTRIRE